MVIALFGYAGSGKTSLFEILSQKKGGEHYYGHEARLDVPRSVCQVVDARLEKLASLYPEKKKVLVHLEIEDFPGMACGEISTSLYLSQLRKADGLVHVVRGFKNPAVPHPRGKINPADDIKSMTEELVLSDLVMVTGRLERLDKDLKKVKDAEAQKEKELLAKLRPLLEEGQLLRDFPLTPSEEKMLRGFCFLSLKPVLQMINLDEQNMAYLDYPGELYAALDSQTSVLAFCGKIEKEIMDLEDEEQALFMNTYGLEEPTPSRFFRKIFEVMDLINFYTIGKDEVRSWLIKKNTPAVKAAGEIHSDLEKGFIRAEVIPFEELIKSGSWQKAKEAGALRLEGKDYPVHDGDVVYFRFSQ